MKNKKILKIVIFIILVVAIIGIIFFCKKDKQKTKEIIDVSISEIENININNNDEIVEFYNKYYGKTLKITGFVSSYSDEYYSSLGEDLATGVNIGNSSDYINKVLAYGVTYNDKISNQIKKLNLGDEITIIGNIPNPEVKVSMPVEIYIEKIEESINE